MSTYPARRDVSEHTWDQTQLDSLIKRGQQFYENELREPLIADHKGEYVVIDTRTLSYEIASDPAVAVLRMLDKDPACGRFLYHLRVGYTLSYGIRPKYVEEGE